VPDDDSLGWARLTNGDKQLVLSTASGQVIRFQEKDVRPMGLPAGGVMGIKLANDMDGVVAMDVYRDDGYIWSVTDNGLAKTTPTSAYPIQGRYGQGVINVRLPKGANEVVSTVIGDAKDDIYVMTAGGSARRIKLGTAVNGNRPIKPRPIVRLGDRNRITGAVGLQPRPVMPIEE